MEASRCPSKDDKETENWISCSLVRIKNGIDTLENSLAVSLKKKPKHTFIYGLAITFLNIYPREMKIYVQPKTGTRGTSLLVQWLRICLTMQGTWV